MPTIDRTPTTSPMLLTRVKAFYGLTSPFDFKVAVPFLLSALGLIVVFLVCLFQFFAGDLSLGSVRFYFFAYIACFLLIAAVFSKFRTLSYVLLCWCTVELCLAAASPGLRPPNFVFNGQPEFPWVYHPLLQLVPRPNFQYTNYPDLSGHEAEAKAGGIDVAAIQGKELKFVHNSLGIRGKQLTADDLRKDLIFVYGGSTTYDVGVTQGETWVEHLQSDLDNKYTVVNFGVVGHSTEEHLIDTAFYQDVIGKPPVCAIYYVGWNDVINAHLENLDSGYANYHSLTLAVRRTDLSIAKYSPLMSLFNDVAKKRFDTVPQIPPVLGGTPLTGSDKRLEGIFVDHIRSIAAINGARGIKTIFIGQMINKDWPQGPNLFAPLVKTGDFPNLIARFNALLRDTVSPLSAKYIDAGNANFQHTDFVDYAHFAPLGTKKFAGLISGPVDGYCQ